NRRVGVGRFLASVGVWQSLAVIEWLVFAVAMLAVATVAWRGVVRLRDVLEPDGTWPQLRWILLGSLALNLAGIWWGLPGSWVPIELVPSWLLDALSRHFSHGWYDAYPPAHFYVLSIAISPVLVMHALGRVDLSGPAGYTVLVLICRSV